MDSKIISAINSKLNSDFRIVKQFDSGIANLNYLLQNSMGKKVVARVLKEQKPENLDFELLVQTKLNSSSLKSPLLFTEPNGKPILIKIRDQNISISSYIEADPHPKHFPNSLLVDLGEVIAKFQLATSHISVSRVPENYLSKSYQDKLKFRPEDQKTAQEIKQFINNLYSRIDKLKLPKSNIHGDLNEGNILIKNSKIIAVLDFETVEYKERILDLGIAFYYRQQGSGLSYLEVAKLITSGFERISTLSLSEKQAIPLATQYAAACFSLWSLANEPADPDYNFLEGFHSLQKRIEEGFNV